MQVAISWKCFSTVYLFRMLCRQTHRTQWAVVDHRRGASQIDHAGYYSDGHLGGQRWPCHQASSQDV